jgi:dUTP pyrophosphatase
MQSQPRSDDGVLPKKKKTRAISSFPFFSTMNTGPLLCVKLAHKDAKAPKMANDGDAGYDLFSCEAKVIPAGEMVLVSTGVRISITRCDCPVYGRVAPRSGLASKHRLTVEAGVIDQSYRGIIGVLLTNHSKVDFEVKAGDRIAQLIIERIVTPMVVEVDELDETVRGEGGFGSTGS